MTSDPPSESMPDDAFSVLAPRGKETPVVVEIPHAGTRLEPEARQTLVASPRAIRSDADLYVDELYADAPDLGATVLVSHLSRYVCDLNRSETDFDHRAVVGAGGRPSPHGLIWWCTTHGEPALTRPLRPEELARRVATYYRPYHERLHALLEDRQQRFGFAILLCAHSMPSEPRPRVGRQERLGPHPATERRADVVPGSQGRTTAADAVVDCPADLAMERGWTVAHDVPYRGGFSTVHYGRPARRIHAIQVELSRALYMDEATLQRLPGRFEGVRAFCGSLVTRLSRLDLAS